MEFGCNPEAAASFAFRSHFGSSRIGPNPALATQAAPGGRRFRLGPSPAVGALRGRGCCSLARAMVMAAAAAAAVMVEAAARGVAGGRGSRHVVAAAVAAAVRTALQCIEADGGSLVIDGIAAEIPFTEHKAKDVCEYKGEFLETEKRQPHLKAASKKIVSPASTKNDSQPSVDGSSRKERRGSRAASGSSIPSPDHRDYGFDDNSPRHDGIAADRGWHFEGGCTRWSCSIGQHHSYHGG